MLAAAARWRELHGVALEWDFRPLASFNDQPVSELVASHDLLVIDHPLVGAAAAANCLAPLDELLPTETLAALAADAVGPSHSSYRYRGLQWALATDAACQVAVLREDLLHTVPGTWDDVLALAQEPSRVALPLYRTDALCSLLTLCASRGGRLGEDPEADEDALAYPVELLPHLHPGSFGFNPPRTLDRMSSADEIAYVPLAFGYANYSRPGRSARLSFVDIPTRGAVLGGAGLAVSATATDPVAAAAFAAWATGAETQRKIVFPAGGQPGSRSVWLDPAADAAAGGFFSGTLATIESSYVRPREPWWPAFQERAGELLVHRLHAGRRPP